MFGSSFARVGYAVRASDLYGSSIHEGAMAETRATGSQSKQLHSRGSGEDDIIVPKVKVREHVR